MNAQRDMPAPSPARPRVSAVITTYNYAAFIRDAIESVLAQTRPPDEVVVIDDGSTDDTAEIVQTYAASGVRYVYQDNQGAGAARNRGIRETSGELIAFLDADDSWLPDKLEHQTSYLATHPDAVLVSGQMCWWDTDADERWIKQSAAAAGGAPRRDIVVRNIVGNPSMTLVRRSALDACGGFDSSLRWGQDWELWIRLVMFGRVGFLREPVITYRWHGASLTHANAEARLTTLHGISRRAIRRYHARVWRPLLLARSWSFIEVLRARTHPNRGRARWRRAFHAARALVAYPLEDTVEKAKLLTRSLVGETIYARMRELRAATPGSPAEQRRGVEEW